MCDEPLCPDRVGYEPEEEPECTCAMTEASMVSCAIHGYDAPEL